MFRHRNRTQKAILPLFEPSKQKSKGESGCLKWSNLVLGALIPLSIGIGTVVITVLQQHVDMKRQHQERELDDRRYELEQEQDDRRYNLQQEQSNELHYQSVFKTYIEDISNILYKSNQSNSFPDEKMKLNYITSKTLVALDDLDWQRKSRSFLFLYNNEILPNNSNTTINLAGANLNNISINGLPYRNIQFQNLQLQSTILTNASFIGCDFKDSADFHDSIMTGVKFQQSRFLWDDDSADITSERTNIWFNRSKMIGADFSDAFLRGISFDGVDLSYSNFSHAWLQGMLLFDSVNLSYTDFRISQTSSPLSIIFSNTDLRGVIFSYIMYEKFKQDLVKIDNVIWTNGTWRMNQSNLIMNGDAETDCQSWFDKQYIAYWLSFTAGLSSYPSLSNSSSVRNVSDGHCTFNFTNQDGTVVAMYQEIDISKFSVFIDSGELNYTFSVNECCQNGYLEFFGGCFGESMNRLSTIAHAATTNGCPWKVWSYSGKIPVLTRRIRIQIGREANGTCFVDNIQLSLQRNN